MESTFPPKRLKYVVSLRRSRVDGSEDEKPYVGLENIESWTGRLIEESESIKEEPVSQPSEGTSISNTFEPGDVLFGKLRPYLAKTWIAEFSGRSTTELLVMQPKEAKSRFLRYVFLWRDFVDSVDASTFGSKMPRADWNFIGNMLVPLPSLEQQDAIADYLDRETARIDALIAAKERLLELLAEKRRALITRAVTRGLNPDVPLRDSGVPWLGEIPAHWRVIALKRISSLKSGDFITSESISTEGDYPVFGGNGLRGFTSSFTHDGEYVLIGRQGALCGNINYAYGRFWASEHAVVLTIAEEYSIRWLGELLDVMNLNQYSQSAAQPGLAVEFIANLKIPVPPAIEQYAIAETIIGSTKQLDKISKATESTIALLKERRAALIAAAVTGQIDVGGTA
jgi:type I restriction enzyme S subunit